MSRHHINLHLISDATGETLIAASRAVVAQYEGVCCQEHVYPMARSVAAIDRAIAAIEAAPGMVLFTLVDPQLAHRLADACARLGAPCLSVLAPIMNLFESYIGVAATPRPGAQHSLNADYFRRIDALNFTMMHDDGQHSESYEAADVVLMGVSRTSKTPTSIYLANRGVKTANLPFVPNTPLPKSARIPYAIRLSSGCSPRPSASFISARIGWPPSMAIPARPMSTSGPSPTRWRNRANYSKIAAGRRSM